MIQPPVMKARGVSFIGSVICTNFAWWNMRFWNFGYLPGNSQILRSHQWTPYPSKIVWINFCILRCLARPAATKMTAAARWLICTQRCRNDFRRRRGWQVPFLCFTVNLRCVYLNRVWIHTQSNNTYTELTQQHKDGLSHPRCEKFKIFAPSSPSNSA